MKRQQIGYALTLLALSLLLIGFSIAAVNAQGSVMQRLVSISISLIPLLLFAPRAFKRDYRSYQSLALLAPVYFFFGGVIWLWQPKPYWGLYFCSAALLLEIGCILHNYQRRAKRK